MFRTLHNFPKKNSENFSSMPLELKLSRFPLTTQSSIPISSPKLHSLNLQPKPKLPKVRRMVLSSQSKRSSSMKSLFPGHNSEKNQEESNPEREYFVQKFKKKPGLFDKGPKKLDFFESENNDISGIENDPKEENNNSVNEIIEIMEKRQGKSAKLEQNLESGEKTTLGSYQSSKETVDKKANFVQKPITLDNENLERFNGNQHNIDLKLIRKNLFSRQKAIPIYQRASTSQQMYRVQPQKQKEDLIFKLIGLEEECKKQLRKKEVAFSTGSNFYAASDRFVGDSNFIYSGEKINPKYNDSHLKYK